MTERKLYPFVVKDMEGNLIDRFHTEQEAQRYQDRLHWYAFPISSEVYYEQATEYQKRPLTEVYLPDSGTYIAPTWFVSRCLKSNRRKSLVKQVLEIYPESFTRKQLAAYPDYVLALILNQI